MTQKRFGPLALSVLTHILLIYSLSPGHHDDHSVLWFEGTLELGEAGDGHSERLHFHQEPSRKKHPPHSEEIQNPEGADPAVSAAAAQAVDLSAGGSPGQGGAALSEGQRYLLTLIQRLDALKTYPRDSLLREEEGLVILTLVIHPNGQIESSEVSNPSPFLSLNRAALEAARKLPALPPLPSEWTKSIRVKIPISYRLTR